MAHTDGNILVLAGKSSNLFVGQFSNFRCPFDLVSLLALLLQIDLYHVPA
jgi:hypothetical protein